MHRALAGLPPTSQVALQRVIDTEGLQLHSVSRRGPRFFVAEVTYRSRRAIWKICVQPAAQDPWSATKFSREIRFLHFLHNSQNHSVARRFAPRLFSHALGRRPWYIREYIAGRDYAKTGNIRFVPAFFTAQNLRAVLSGFRDLQSIRAAELPPALRASLHRYDTIDQWLKFLRPFWKDINTILKDPVASQDLRRWLKARARVYGSIPAALSHSEPYAPHFLRYANKLRLIDWENINWANPTADAIVLWMRADGHAAWQKALERGWRRHWKKLGKKFDLAWETDLVVRSIFTLLSARTYADQADIRPLGRVAKKVVQKTLKEIRNP